MNCHILEAEGRKKLKIVEVSLQICQNCLRENGAKNFRPDCSLNLSFQLSKLFYDFRIHTDT